MRVCCVCTGNTCRSPMLVVLLAAALTKAGIKDVTVESAGTGVGEAGGPASDGAVRAMQRRGLALTNHQARPITGVELGRIDQFLCMSSRHAAAVRNLDVPAVRISVVNAEAGGVPDPFGGNDGEYESCARVLEGFASAFVTRLKNPA